MMRGKQSRREPRPRPDAAIAAPAARLPATAMTWIGLGIVGLGWVVQIGGGTLAAAPVGLVALAQSLILSGFGLAILAALQSGFGALNRFFETIAQRSAAASARQPAAPPPPPAPVVTVSPRPDPNRLKGRGRIGERPYLQFADGSVEVETLLGSRRFDSLEEARAFVGA